MRIQHNIMAMNAYRNYNTNTSALSKNLEKLSSGYKINRAGDDAAGLAISEKMRAQITGLNAAQKNVKDGISLVKTAEGAMQEIQDMLNRMDYLATQSANGTYDNEVDRANLQKEVDALKTEINRIADSANFNGIKLLDGSLDANADMSASADLTVGGDLPEVGLTLGTDTVLHNENPGNGGSEFSVELHNFHFTADEGNTMTMTVGGTTFELTVNANGDGSDLTGEDLAKAILGQDNKVDVTVNGEAYNNGDKIKINGQDFTVSAGDGKVTFVQDATPKSEAEEVDPSMQVSITGATADVKAEYSIDVSALYTAAADGDTITVAGKTVALDKAGTHNDADALGTALEGLGFTDYDAEYDTATKKLTLTAKAAGPKDTPAATYGAAGGAATAAVTTTTTGAEAVAGAAPSGFTETRTGNPDGYTNGQSITSGDWAGSVTIDGGGDASIAWTYNGSATGAVTGPDGNTHGTDAVAATNAVYDYALTDWDGDQASLKVDIGGTATALAGLAGDWNVTVDTTNKTLTLTAKNAGAIGTSGPATAPGAASYNKAAQNATAVTVTEEKAGKLGGEIKGITQGANGDWNVSTTDIKNVTSGGLDRLASTYFDLTEDMASEGSKIRIGDDEYTFTSDKSLIGQTGYVDISSGDLDKIAKNLTDAAAGNAVWTVGHDGSRITVTETVTHGDLANKANKYSDTYKYDLSTKEGIADSLGFTAGESKTGKALTLQIGDTSDSFNQMKVSVGDMHTKAMGTEGGASIADIDISTQDGASAAVNVIKDAINYVSGVRGDLGAIQNRLEHTQNNLSVMAENIQDAESTIRDTDVAEEMMSYVKNNILVQSAQAMLAQANQVPQGVLQLLG